MTEKRALCWKKLSTICALRLMFTIITFFFYYLYLLNTDCNFPFRQLSMPPPIQLHYHECDGVYIVPTLWHLNCSTARYFCFYQFRFISLCSTRIVNWKEITMTAITEYLIRNESCRISVVKRAIYIKCLIHTMYVSVNNINVSAYK